MALQRDTLYAGRFSTATTAHPQGAFKNRTTPTAQDGSYLEKDWLNDWDGFFGSLLSNAGLTPNGNVDAVGASQYYTALSILLSTNFNRTLLTTPVGTSRNLKCSVTAASVTATFTANELVVGTSLSGSKYHISSFSKSITLTTTGAGGMDTGSAPVSGYVAIYAIYNPTTQTSALLGYNATSVVAPEVYSGSNLPVGYTASALISVLPTNSSSQFKPIEQLDRAVSFVPVTAVSSTLTSLTTTQVSVSSIIPKNAGAVSGWAQIANSSTSFCPLFVSLSETLATVGSQLIGGYATAQGVFRNLKITVSQSIFYGISQGAGYSSVTTIAINGYTF